MAEPYSIYKRNIRRAGWNLDKDTDNAEEKEADRIIRGAYKKEIQNV